MAKGFRIKRVGDDGNCMFRAVSHQLYGTEDHHFMIRQRCMDFLQINKSFYESFIVGSSQTFDHYVTEKRKDRIWGDDVELQLLSELYSAPIDIYSGGDNPVRTFRESQDGTGRVIRLSYHRRSHYNSVVKMDNPENTGVVNVMEEEPGALEDKGIALSIARNSTIEEIKTNLNDEEGLYEEGVRSQLNNIINGSQGIIDQYRMMVEASRQTFEDEGRRDIDLAIEESLKLIDRESIPQAELRTEESKAIAESAKIYEERLDEEEMLRIALQESLENSGRDHTNLIDEQHQQFNDGAMDYILEQSRLEHERESLRYNPLVLHFVSQGFQENLVIQAVAQFGNNEDTVMSFLCSNLS